MKTWQAEGQMTDNILPDFEKRQTITDDEDGAVVKIPFHAIEYIAITRTTAEASKPDPICREEVNENALTDENDNELTDENGTVLEGD